MAHFLVLALSHSDQIKQALEKHIPSSDRFDLTGSSAWLVSYPGTAADLNEKLGTKGGDNGNLLIAALTDISGYGPNDMIRWIDKH